MTQPSTSSRQRSGRSRFVTVTAAIALFGVAVAGLGLVLGLRPVRTPTHDCGSAFIFLVDGRSNRYVDPERLPAGVTEAEAIANNEEPCQERAANRARPAAFVLVAGVLVGLGSAATEAIARTRWRAKAVS